MMPLPIDDPKAQAAAGRRSFLYLMLGFAALFTLVMAQQLWRIYTIRTSVVGDGEHVESYHFDLSNLTVPREQLVASGMSRDSQPVVDGMELVVEQNVGDLKHAGYHATTLPILKELDERNFKSWTRFVVSHDEVIGVTINGESRAYPIRYLRWHEIVNDTIGGAPVAVTYNPLCDSSVVFDRRLNGITLNFGFSGLLYNSNLVMYDRDSMSLFCQLKAAAIAGPLAGQSLTVLPLWYGTWKDWSEQHPDTSVFTGNNIYKERYYRDPLPDYYDKGELRFPVAPLPPPGGRALMDIVQSPTMRARWFAWYALRGDKIE